MTQFKFFSIPIAGDDSLESELNSFLRSVRVVSKTVQLSSSGAQPCWGICVEYFSSDYVKGSVPPRGKRASSSIDYREVLSEEDFVVFARLREVRKAIAEEKGYPPYAIFTNEQLAQMVQTRCRSLADLQKISGIGESKLKSYGAAFISALTQDAPFSESSEESSK